MGAKDLTDLKSLREKEISMQYKQALDSIAKKEILDQIEKLHEIELPKNLVEQEIHLITHGLKKEEIEKNKAKNLKIAESRIKLGLILNEYGVKNNLNLSDDDVKGEIQKQIKEMPGQEKLILDYYQKNPSSVQSLKGTLYEEKILNLFKSKINLKKKDISITEAEKIISNFNKLSKDLAVHHDHNHDHDHNPVQEKETKEIKERKISKSSTNIKNKKKLVKSKL